MVGAVLFVVLTSLGRMAFGAHFLSDVVGATLIVLLVVAALRALIVRPPGRTPDRPQERAR